MQNLNTLSASIIIPDNTRHSQLSNRVIQSASNKRSLQSASNKRSLESISNRRSIQSASNRRSVQIKSNRRSVQSISNRRSVQSISNRTNRRGVQSLSQMNNESNSQNKSRLQTMKNMSDFDLTIQSTFSAFGIGLTHHLSSLKRTNLINILSSKSSQQRTQRQNKLIMEILKHQPFFNIISSNYKLLYEISSKLQYKSFKQSQFVYRINQITEGYFILIRGSVQLSIPQRMINSQSIIQTENQKLLRQIQTRNQLKLKNQRRKSPKLNKKTLKTKLIDSQSNSKKKTLHQHLPNELINLKQLTQQNHESAPKDHSKKLISEESILEISPQKQHPQLKEKKSTIIKLPKKQSVNQKYQLFLSTKKLQLSQSTKKLQLSQSTKKLQLSQFTKKQQLSQSTKKFKQPALLSKKTSSKLSNAQQTFWSPTQFNLHDHSDILSQNQSILSDIQVQKQQPPLNPQNKEGTVLQYIDKIVKVVEEGECFGEITVGQINKRATNAFVKYDSHLIVIKKQHYELISKASIISQMKTRHDFLFNLQLFKKVYRYSVQTFLYYMTEVPCQYKSLLYKEGDQIKYVYLVKNGEFNLSKTITDNNNKKIISNNNMIPEENPDIVALRRQSSKWREGVLKKVYFGQILGDCEAFLKKSHYNESCKCTSQSGSIYRIDKNVFIEKLLSSENQVAEIKKYLNAKYKTKLRYIDNFIQKQFKNQVIARILPASQSCDRNIKRRHSVIKFGKNQTIQIESCDRNIKRRHSVIRSQTALGHMQSKQEDDNSPIKNQFFDQFNRTFHPSATKKRIFATYAINMKKQTPKQQDPDNKFIRCKTAIHRSVSLTVKTQPVKQTVNRSLIVNKSLVINKSQLVSKSLVTNKSFVVSKSLVVNKSEVPSCIKDIVAVVNCKQQYFQNRNKSTDKHISFQFEKHKLPIFIAQKFKHLVNKLQMKKK